MKNEKNWSVVSGYRYDSSVGLRIYREELVSDLDRLSAIWERLERILIAHYGSELPMELIQLRLAITEGIVNTIEHAHHEDGRSFGVVLQLSEEALGVMIEDTGTGRPAFHYDVANQDEPVELVEWEAEGGRGTFLMTAMMDEVAYIPRMRPDEPNILSLRKRFESKFESLPTLLEHAMDQPRRILLIDDSIDFRLLVRRIIEKMGHEVDEAETGARGIELFAQRRDYAVVLIDFELPDATGLDIVRALRAASTRRYTPLVMVSARGASQDVAAGLDAGADDYLRKPIKKLEVNARLRAAFRLRDMAEQLSKRTSELASQLREARALQLAIVPKQALAVGNVEFCSLFRPCDYVGGDMFNYFRLDEEHVGFYLADVSGHGVASAMLSIWVNRVLQPSLQNGGILKQLVNRDPGYILVEPQEICATLDRNIEGQQTDKFLTIFYGILHTPSRTLNYCSAGHTSVLVHRAGGDTEWLDATSGAVGMGFGFQFEAAQCQLQAGDALLVYSDCAEETRGENGEFFGAERLAETFAQSSSVSAPERLQHILEAIRHFSGQQSFDDDLTLLGVQLS